MKLSVAYVQVDRAAVVLSQRFPKASSDACHLRAVNTSGQPAPAGTFAENVLNLS